MPNRNVTLANAEGLKRRYVELEHGVYAEVFKAELKDPNESRYVYEDPTGCNGQNWVELKRYTAPQDLFLDGIKLTKAGTWVGEAIFRIVLLGKRTENLLMNGSVEYGDWGVNNFPENWVKAGGDEATWEYTGRDGGKSVKLHLAASGQSDGWRTRLFAIPGGMHIKFKGWFKGTTTNDGLKFHFIYYDDEEGTSFKGEQYHNLAINHSDWTLEEDEKVVEFDAKSARIWFRQAFVDGVPNMEMDDVDVYAEETVIYPAKLEETVNDGNYVAFPQPLRVQKDDLICVKFRSSNAGDDSGDTLELNELRMRLANHH
ncbi:MAG: hypothetical protein SVY53_10960 [Chloroflexota bacterium]|nr:hypothetical protein [Chloroflexota bacterium]